jgi:hypothetical protein
VSVAMSAHRRAGLGCLPLACLLAHVEAAPLVPLLGREVRFGLYSQGNSSAQSLSQIHPTAITYLQRHRGWARFRLR